MQTPDRLTLTLQRIEEFLAVLRLEDFGYDVEGGQRVIDDLGFLQGELSSGHKTLPFPRGSRRPLDIAYGYEGHFNQSFSELEDRTVDLLDLFKATRWPLLPWQAEPLGDSVPQEGELRDLYARLRATLIDRRIDDLMSILAPSLQAASNSLGRDDDFELECEQEFIEELMRHPDYRSESPSPELPTIKPMFDGCRVRLLHPSEERHALGIWPYTSGKDIYPIQCQFGRIDGHWTVVGYD